jgi:ribose 5-phosphate isomerase B
MKVVIGADSWGLELKDTIKAHLSDKSDIAVEDLGVNRVESKTPYYQIASDAAMRVADGSADRGILVCGTGMGMSIIANKHPGVFAAVCETVFAAEKSRSINNSNVLTLGGFITTPTIAREIVDAWLSTEFTQDWDPDIRQWLQNSMGDINDLERKQFTKAPRK